MPEPSQDGDLSLIRNRAGAIAAMQAPVEPLIGEVQIRDEIESLPPIAQEACRVALNRMPDIQNIKHDRPLLYETVVKSFALVGLSKGMKHEDIALAVDSFGPRVVRIVYSSLDVIDGIYFKRGKSIGRWAALAGGLAGLLLIG